MFVRIVHWQDTEDSGITGPICDSLYECVHIYRRQLRGLNGPLRDKFDLVLEKTGGSSVTIQINKTERTDIFIMNENGKTIDSYRFGL